MNHAGCKGAPNNNFCLLPAGLHIPSMQMCFIAHIYIKLFLVNFGNLILSDCGMCASTGYLRRRFLYVDACEWSAWAHSSYRIHNNIQWLIFDIYSSYPIFGCGFSLSQYNCNG